MYKSKLLVLCQRNSWPFEFSSTKSGPDHNPWFNGTVTVNGVPFTTTGGSRTSKEAQNNAAKIAFDHFSSPSPSNNPVRNPPQPSLVPVPTKIAFDHSSSSPSPLDPFADFPQPSLVGAALTSPPVPTSSGFDIGTTMIGTSQTPLMSATLVGATDDKNVIDIRHLYKSRLQNYAQKRHLALPEYSSEREGNVHAFRFRSKVTIDGKTFCSPEFSPTVKEAEQAAAKAALESLPVNEVQESKCPDDYGLYKNLLQELAQKEGLDVPKYETKGSGPPHMPTFVSTVEIKGQSFEGQAAKSKKQAETSAAKVAYTELQEHKKLVTSGRACLVPIDLPSGCQIKKALEATSSILQSVITGDWQQSAGPKANLITREEQSKEGNVGVFPGDLQQTAGRATNLVIQKEKDKDHIAGHEEKRSSYLTTSKAEVNNHRAPPSPPDTDINSKRPRCSAPADTIYASLRDPFPSTCSSPEDELPLPVTHSESSQNSTLDSHNETPIRAADGSNASARKRILIYPRGPNVKCPEGATVLPFSDDKWVAMKMNSSQ